MSTPAGTTRYIIAADDKTKGAVASVINGFRSMERNVKATVSRINVGLGLIAGIGVKRAFQNVFTETAKQSKEFAFALDEVKRASRDLLASKEGAPAATAAMRELALVLKDPEVVAAADAITSVFIRGAAGAVKFAAGVKTLEEELEELKLRRNALASGEGEKRRSFIKGEPSFNPSAAQEIFGINAQIGQVEGKIRDREAAAARKLEEFWARVDAAGDRVSRRFETMRQFAENVKFLEALEGMGDIGGDKFKALVGREDRGFFAELVRDGDIAAHKVRDSFVESMDQAARDIGETMQQTGDSIEQVGDAIGDKIEGARESSVFVKEMQKDIFGNVSGLLASAGDGADDFGDRMIDTFKRILSDTATVKLFNYLAGLGQSLSGGEGFSGWVGAGLTALFGGVRDSGGRGEKGKGYVIRPKAGPEVFWPDSAGTFYPRQVMAGAGGGVIINMPIDMRGATVDAVKLLRAEQPRMLRQAIEIAKAQRLDDRRRRGV